jgi:cytochrome P450
LIDQASKPWLALDKLFKFSQSTRDLYHYYKELYEVLKIFSAEHEADYLSGAVTEGRKPRPYLDLHYTLRATMSENQTLESFLMFFGLASDTTGKAMSAALLLLAMNPEEQEKVYAEINSILLSETDEVDEQKLAQMVYLDLVLKETLRLVPQVLVFAREATKDVKLSNFNLKSAGK